MIPLICGIKKKGTKNFKWYKLTYLKTEIESQMWEKKKTYGYQWGEGGWEG